MQFLNQSTFPNLWRIFQTWAGGTLDKQKLALLKYENQKRVLEVGCSSGNIAEAFLFIPNIEYTGIDVDPVVIRHAQRLFASAPNFRFLCQDLHGFARSSARFDFILFAGVCHHLSSEVCLALLKSGRDLLAENGSLVVVDFLHPEPEDNWFLHWYIKLDRGKYLRTDQCLSQLLQNEPGLSLHESEIHYIGGTPYPIPKCARFGIYSMTKSPEKAEALS